MESQARLSPFTARWFVLAVCFFVPGSPAMAQAIPAGPQVPAGQNAQPAPVLRRALERDRLQAETLLRLLELPAVQNALVITDEQRSRIEDISFNVRKEAIQQQAVVRVLRMELELMLKVDAPDRSAIDRKVQEVAQAQAAIMGARVHALMDLRGVLTKEQEDKIRESVLRRTQQRAQARPQQAQPLPKLVPSAPAPPPAPPQPPVPR